MADDKKAPATVRRDYRGTRGLIQDAEGARPASDSGDRRRRRASEAPRRRGTTAEGARRTRHTGSEGERAYGTPMRTGASEREDNGNRRRRYRETRRD